MAGAAAEKGPSHVILWFRANVALQEAEVTVVEIEQEVSVGPQKSSAVQSPLQATTRIGKGLLHMIKRLKNIKYARMLIEKLSGKGGATTGLCKQKDVLPSGGSATASLSRDMNVIAERFPSLLWGREVEKVR